MLTGLNDVVVKEGEAAHFSCRTKPAHANVRWSLNDKSISQTNKYRIEQVADEHRLSIHKCVKKDSGTVCVSAGKFQNTAELVVKGIYRNTMFTSSRNIYLAIFIHTPASYILIPFHEREPNPS